MTPDLPTIDATSDSQRQFAEDVRARTLAAIAERRALWAQWEAEDDLDLAPETFTLMDLYEQAVRSETRARALIDLKDPYGDLVRDLAREHGASLGMTLEKVAAALQRHRVLTVA